MKIIKDIAVIEGDTHISKWVIESGRLDHDQNMLPLVLQHINPGDTVLDIGAYIGDHTIAYANKVGDSGKVLAFEPNPIAYECLEFNMRKLTNVRCWNYALSENHHSLDLNLDSGNYGASWLSKDRGTVISSTIDSLIFQNINFIKIDVEGMEIEVLEGGKASINKFKPKMLIEVNQHALKRNGKSKEQLFMWLWKNNYTYRNIYEYQDMNGEQFDILAYER